MAASVVCQAASTRAQVRSRALLRTPALRRTATFSQTRVSKLNNGLHVASEQSSQPTCTVGVWIDVGSRFETEKNNRAGYFVEHLAFKGTKNWPGSALEKEVESIGAHLNHTAYYIKALSKDLPKVGEILGDTVQNCSLEDSQIEKERDAILREMQKNEASVRDMVFDYLHATAFQGTSLAQAVEGTSENVRKLSRADLTEYLSRHYWAPQMVLAVAGGVEHQLLLDLAQKHLGDISWQYPEDAVPTFTPCRFTGSEIHHHDDTLPLAHVAIAVEGPGWASPDNVALQVANAIISHYDRTYGGGGHVSSPLVSISVAKKLCQSFQTFNICYAETGSLGAHFVCDRMKIGDMIYVLQGQWMRLCTSTMESVVAWGKNILRNALVSQLDGTTPVCEDIRRSLLTYGHRIPLVEWESRIVEVDASVFYDQCPAVAGYGPIEQLTDYNRNRSSIFWLRF
uniref:Cytochrome b-c1 complex subunit 1, mitochondrial n=1 Tax=Cebus imitator TaxID=2715852 RepID=A0A2K5RCR6_CEBIM